MLLTPRLEMSESKAHIVVSAELPGVLVDDLQLAVSQDGTSLSLNGLKKVHESSRQSKYVRSERLYGSFRRILPLPVAVNTDLVEAAFENGVLEINLQKSDPTRGGVKHIGITCV